ncbi:histidine kinase dimerization/phospho-acceptor domain-containing protein [Dendronalium phyllosphericum]|uniref:histidine kinase dimerization/phospho-acceptor domain-containing protein n=1 Tax=Dendronalium phyllosphericum TaxID=2840445 RepID=UPI0021F1A4C7|nr:histidine kinase dimerization/phospho-acceptor domain-containing protein [Dendronalium phyllosphericum]
MKVMIQMLQLPTTPEETQRYLKLMEAECDREMELINDLLDLQRLQTSPSVSLTSDAVLLQEWLPWTIEPFLVRIQERQQILKLNLPSDLPTLFSNSNSLERILIELLNNRPLAKVLDA